MAQKKGNIAGRGKVYFRRCRLAVWLTLLVLLGALCYLNQVGLPGFIKRPLLEKLRAQGIELQFSRLRLRFYQGIVADNVRFGQANEPRSPQLTAGEVTLGINIPALARRHLQLDDISLRQGRLVWPITETNRAERKLTIENIHARLRFLPQDQWELDNFTASFGGAHFELNGSLAHASAIRDWGVVRAGPETSVEEAQNRLRELHEIIEQMQFGVPPEFRLQLSGDARNPESFNARLVVMAPDANTPWGELMDGRLTLRLFPASGTAKPSAELLVKAASAKTDLATTKGLELNFRAASLQGLADLANAQMSVTDAPAGSNFVLRGVMMLSDAHLLVKAEEATTRWATITNLELGLDLSAVPEQKTSLQADLSLAAEGVGTKWGKGSNARLTASWVHALTNAAPQSGRCRGGLDEASGDWGKVGRVEVEASMARSSGGSIDPPAGLAVSEALWTNLTPFILDFGARVREVQTPKLEARAFACSGHWQAPELTVTNLEAQFDSGSVKVGTALNISNRALKFNLASDTDPHRFEPLLSEPVRKFLGQLVWAKPPQVEAGGALVLPAWTNRQPDWAAEVTPTLQLNGQFNLKNGGAFSGIPATSAQSHFSYSNQTWRLPDLKVTTAKGSLEASHEANERTQSVYWRFRSTVDPASVRPVLDPASAKVLDLFSFTNVPQIEGEFWACSNKVELTRLKGRVFLTNFAFRGESVASLETGVEFTNGFVQCSSPHLRRAGGLEMTADSVVVDLKKQLLYLTNGYSTVEPMFVARCIGTNVIKALEPYQFTRPPTVHAYGIIPLRGEDDADLYFKVLGGPFHWWNFHVPMIAGNIHWQGQHLALTEVGMDFYGGRGKGLAGFDFHPGGAATYSMKLQITNSLLQLLMADLSAHTNRLEGLLSGTLVFTKSSTEDWHHTDGYGDVELRDGTIWDIPLFGIFSDVLNGIAPSLGNSRANAGSATFGITNGVIHSDDLEIRTPTFRLQYKGNIDLDGHVNAKVEASFLRNMWVVGPLVSTVFWPVTKIFEFKVTGTLDKPKAEPVFLIPKLLMLPFHPLRALKDLAPDNSRSSPPQWPEE
jgi:AsmA-like C-terminal region